jgi:hypothetical protein
MLNTHVNHTNTIKNIGGPKSTVESSKKSMYSLSLPSDVLDEIKRVAEKEETSILQVLRNFIKLGLAYYRMRDRDPNTQLIIRQGNTEHVILLF